MKLRIAALSASVMMLFVGCAETKTDTGKPAAVNPGSAKGTPEASSGLGAPAPVDQKATDAKGATAAKPAAAAGQTPVALKDGAAELTPENSRIQFVGTHTGEKPDPRLGGFTKFTGKVAADKGAVTSASFDIDSDSMWTEFDKLTNHLKGPDFFDTKEFPEIKFQSTKVESSADGKIAVTGDLTLHGQTKPILVPGTVTITDAGIVLVAEFTIDRTEFGISYEPGKVDKTVSLTVVIGEKTQPKPSAGG